MSEADKMFNELGLIDKKEWSSNGEIYIIEYVNISNDKMITFYCNKKEIKIIGKINKDELKALYKKCQELDWF